MTSVATSCRSPATAVAGRALASFLPAAARGLASHRPVNLSHPKEGELRLGNGAALRPASNFWEEVADHKAMADAPLYVNNIENYIGTVKLPVGLVGPLRVLTEEATQHSSSSTLRSRDYCIPMATTEGALVASYNRGAKAIREAGGATAAVISRQMVRAPVFVFDRAINAARFVRWFKSSHVEGELREKINQEPHCHAVELYLMQTDRCVHLHIGIDSEDAAGQNMVTYCGRVAMDFLQEKYGTLSSTGLQDAFIEGGMNSGKRGSGLHLGRGKGFYTIADCLLPHDIVQKVLHTTPRKLVDFQHLHSRSSSYLGTLSLTGHVANALTAFFIATGQDAACTAESQAAVTHFELLEDLTSPEKPSLLASITMPSLMVATLGGGTGLPSQRACLDLLGIEHPEEVACVLASACLAGDLSFYGAIVSGEFDRAHWAATHKQVEADKTSMA